MTPLCVYQAFNPWLAGFTIQGINHRCGKVDIHSFLLLQRALGFGEIQRTRKVNALVNLSTEAPPWSQAFLQVEAVNAGALARYWRAGLVTAWMYQYREKPV